MGHSETSGSVASPIINAKLGKQVKREETQLFSISLFLSLSTVALLSYIISVAQRRRSRRKISNRASVASDQPF